MKSSRLLQATIILVSFCLVLGFYSCSQPQEKAAMPLTQQGSVKPKLYGINGKEIFIQKDPGQDGKRFINHVMTERTGEPYYHQIDNTFKVVILDESNGWVYIKTIEPRHLSDSHNGWIESKYLLRDKDKLDPKSYDIVLTKHNSAVENYHVVVKIDIVDAEQATAFVSAFREEHCKRKANINLYDTESVKHLMDKYPVEGIEYIELADHFVAHSTFDSPETVWWYPFQDIKYKELGGNNWKKEF